MLMKTEVVHIFETADYDGQIAKGAAALRRGGVVVLPTETVYGAAAVLTHSDGMKRLAELRGGEPNKPFTVHLARREDAAKFLGKTSDYANRLMKKLWPGPVGLMFEVPADRRAAVAKELGIKESTVYDNGSIVLRFPDHLIAGDVIREVDAPVVVSRAGQSSKPDELAKELEGKVDLFFEAGQPQYAKPSTLLKVLDNRYEIVRAGVYDQRIIDRLLRTTVLFVCSGNTCRSPMAEAIAKQFLAKKFQVTEHELEKKGITVLSAGTFAMPGARATPQGVEAVKAFGAELSSHRSRPLTVELIHQADVIYTMGRGHASAVASLVPSATDKTFTLDPEGDIEDPIGGDLELYQSLAGQMQKLIELRLSKNDILP